MANTKPVDIAISIHAQTIKTCSRCRAERSTEHHEDWVIYDPISHAVYNAKHKVFTLTLVLGTSYHSMPHAFDVLDRSKWMKHAGYVVRERYTVTQWYKEQERKAVRCLEIHKAMQKCPCVDDVDSGLMCDACEVLYTELRENGGSL